MMMSLLTLWVPSLVLLSLLLLSLLLLSLLLSSLSLLPGPPLRPCRLLLGWVHLVALLCWLVEHWNGKSGQSNTYTIHPFDMQCVCLSGIKLSLPGAA
jgi:hypothetical protein